LRVGTGSSYTTGALTANPAVDLITFTPALATLGSGTAVAGTGGDLTGGVETAAIVTNSSAVSLTATATGALTDGNANTIPYTQVTTAASALTATYTLLPAPVLANGVSAPVTLTAAANKTITADAKWTYSYANAAVVPAGTYGGVNTNNSRIVYTATVL
jgi:DNA-binding transcriptional regulator LsrR (DeoR family)